MIYIRLVMTLNLGRIEGVVLMAKVKANKDRYYYPAADDPVLETRRGASEKPLGRRVSKEEQKASRKFLTNKRKHSGANPEENTHTQASKSNQDL